MRSKLTKEKLAVILLYMTIVVMALAFNFANPGNIETSEKLQKLNKDIGKDSVSVYVQVVSFDEIHQTAKIRIYIYPPKRFGNAYANSVQIYFRTKLMIDAVRVENNEKLVWNSGDFIRAIDFEIDATNEAFSSRSSDAFYPFDRYSLKSFLSMEIQIEGEETKSLSDDVWISPPLRIIPYTTVLPGWSLNYGTYVSGKESIDLFENGELALELRLERPLLHKYIVLFLSIIFLLGSLAISTYALRVFAGRKRPEIEGLVWSASTIFTLIQTRNVLPNDPRIGIKLDLLVFYPAIAITFLGSTLIFYSWLNQESNPK